MTRPIVSVVMPVFNHPARRLRRAVESILNQTYSDFELIVVDGGSTDANSRVIGEFDDPRIVFRKAKGYINCLNLGLKTARGAYIARMDSDDVSLPQRLEEQVRFLEQNPRVDLCSCQAELFGDAAPRVTDYPENVDLAVCVEMCGIVHPAMMFRRELNVEFEHVKPCEDSLLFRRLLLDGRVIKNLNKVLFKSRVNGDSIMARHPEWTARLMSKINLDAFDRLPDLKGKLGFSALDKKRFSVSDFSNFFAFVEEAKKSDALRGMRVGSVFRPYLDYMISHCENKPAVWCKLLTSRAFHDIYRSARAIFRQIFSVRNKRLPDGRKIKVLTVSGLEIVLRKTGGRGEPAELQKKL